MKKLLMVFVLLIIALCKNILAQVPDTATTTRSWDKAHHNAFTTLVSYHKKFYCAFRESDAHVGVDGKIRILSSTNGDRWDSVALIAKPGVDLRDPKLSVMPNGKLMLLLGGSVYQDKKLVERHPHVAFANKNGSAFSAPVSVKFAMPTEDNHHWIWSIQWHNGIGYAVDYYQPNGHWANSINLLKTTDGITYHLVSQPQIDGKPNETALQFDKNNNLYLLTRREGDDKTGILCKSSSPYTNWSYQKLNYRLSGPSFLFLNDTSLLIGTRYFNPTAQTALLITNLRGEIQRTIILPSGGDTSYAGMVTRHDTLYVSYYSSHEGHASIYFSKIPLLVFNSP